MELKKALELIWLNRKYATSDAKEALSHLNEEVAESLKALMKNDKERACRELEDAMSCLFIAFKVLNIDPDEAVIHQIAQMKKRHERVMVIKQDKAELYVNNTLKGSWSIWGDDDIEDAQKIAKQFGCKVIYKNIDTE
jgi:phosphoribosyl-ATP pyrophosphohydrolase